MMNYNNRSRRYPIFLSILWVMVSGASTGLKVQAQNLVPDNTERVALLALYNSTDGANWTLNQWTVEQINGYPDSVLLGVEVTNGDVSSITLTGSNLTGTLPAELNDLTELVSINLSSNYLSGAIPDLSALQKLRTLNLYFNDFTGTIPSTLGSLTSLTSLNLTSRPNTADKLSGPIPSTFSGLTNLTNLTLSYNNLSQTEAIPGFISSLDNLVQLGLAGCSLVPHSVSTGLTGLASLNNLNLSQNPAFVLPDGTLPDVLIDLPLLSTLLLDGNGFDKLPASFDLLSSLSYLGLSNTNYSNLSRLASVVDTLRLSPALKTLVLSNCNLVGLPSNFHQLATLENLYISNNTGLQTAQWEVIGQMPSLVNLYASNCNLSELPTGLANLTTLRLLFLQSNQLNPIPDVIRDIPDLWSLNLNYNGITSLPSWVGSGNTASWRHLDINNNQIPFPLPANFAGLTNLIRLDMSHNNLAGALPSYFSGFVSINHLNLSNNQLISPLPDLSGWNSIHTIYLQYNQFTGDFPSYLSNVTVSKSNVNISHNQFEGFPSYNASGTLRLYVDNNKLDFFDIVRQTASLRTFGYAPQDSVDTERQVVAYDGSTATLVAHIDTATVPQSSFQWFKYVDGVNDIALTSPQTGVYRYTFNVTSLDDSSTYYYKVTNTAYPALTLNGRKQYLTVLCGIPPDQIDFTHKRYLCAIKFTPQVAFPAGCWTTSYEWNFGDGGTSSYGSPWHAYEIDGTYDVSMCIRYSCGTCVGDTTIVKPVQFSLPLDLVRDSLISVTTDVSNQVIAVTASTFSDSWPLQFENGSLNDRSSYLNGTTGVWRNEGVHVYEVPRTLSPQTRIDRDGTFTLEHFSWQLAGADLIPNWIKANTMTEYSPFSYELENRDVLDISSAALYDYGGHLPSANGINMRNKEMAFTGFEFLDNKASGNWIFGNQPIPAYSTFDIVVGWGYMAVVDATVAELQEVEKADVSARQLAGFWAKRMHYVSNNHLICIEEHPNDPALSLVVFRRAPFEGLWLGRMRVRNDVTPIISPDIDNTVAHTGQSSLRITADKIFEQKLLQLDSGKSYMLNVWASVNDPSPAQPSLGSGIGIDVVFKDKDDLVLSTVSLTPGGRIIEGWQQLKGTFSVPDKNATLELRFKPGSAATAWFDDLRLHPNLGNMKSYVYDLKDYRLQAILDEENFASFFYYDVEGNLYLTKKETEDGIKTISQNVSYIRER